ncbi:uncharacterized protein MYCGRDRAFT_40213 [Zymoseptoria tritici IPO323]|uniref:2-(3-amino-3-carboxypropyl)histidine synthase subunit 2 n=1 Tax=Zymoseptoria tritici (strain CBS 115943 / IPO323) TaxID=336722 RepID=F9X9D7_ZYMTI|nr:uncharacterized protein MYCGRDRAFT_40213 [Zymoseptoria tritici IPO323]EGP87857.1 hypothetical protein MYCGRDRAFT_40213 [Zymoseptoria tritici IPO323]
MSEESAPVLSTPADYILEPVTAAGPTSRDALSEEQLHLQYEIRRTIDEIRQGRWRKIALQFPDDMLRDAPRVFEALRDGLEQSRKEPISNQDVEHSTQHATVEASSEVPIDNPEETICILADTSYGSCCVDEVAAEHCDAEVVVHYGRSCLSPTARLPVIYIFTSAPLDLPSVITSFEATYPDKAEKVCLMADIPYAKHLPILHSSLLSSGYTNLFLTEVVHDPSSLIPNRTVPPEALSDQFALKAYSIFHISTPPTSLLLILTSRIAAMHIYPTATTSPTTTALAPSNYTTPLLRRRYALCTRLSTASIFGILINTLSVSSYLLALKHCQDLITAAGKKSYVFVVGKLNPAKLANFAEVDGWVVVGCWESSLVEGDGWYKPVITPFELEIALQSDDERRWGGEWVGDWRGLLKDGKREDGQESLRTIDDADQEIQDDSDSEPPAFDLRTGRYVSTSRPMGRPTTSKPSNPINASITNTTKPSTDLTIRAKETHLTTIGSRPSPGAAYLNSKRTWQGLGSDFSAYERDEEGRIRGAEMESGREGVAKGYRSHVGKEGGGS